MLREKDYFYALNPNLMKTYEDDNYDVLYESSDDVWSLGITALCFLFNEDLTISMIGTKTKSEWKK